jgi:phosphohistidine phosphatase SixA
MHRRQLKLMLVFLAGCLVGHAVTSWEGPQRSQGPGLGLEVSRICRAAETSTSVVFLVRHAEKGSSPPDDPVLTPEGKARARRLAEIFKYAKVDKLIASEKVRTTETLAPLAAQQKLTSFDRVGDEAAIAESAEGVARLIKGYPPGTVTVVAHHSTTLEPILQKLGVDKAQTQALDTGLYDNLVVVFLSGDKDPRMLKLRYP